MILHNTMSLLHRFEKYVMANGNGAAQAHYLANQNLCANNSYGLWYNVLMYLQVKR